MKTIVYPHNWLTSIAFVTLVVLFSSMALAQNVIDAPSEYVESAESVEPADSPSDSKFYVSQNDWDAVNERLKALESQLKEEKDKAAKKKEADSQKPSLKVTGRLQYEADYFSQNEDSIQRAGNMRNGTELRRAWIGVAGSYKQFEYKADFDLAPSALAFKDVFLEIKELPILYDLRVGYFKEPSGCEQLVGVHQMWFNDRPLSMSGISSYMQNRALGVMASNGSQKANHLWAIGFFQNVSDSIHKHYDDEYSSSDVRSAEGVTARYVYRLMDCPDCGRILHFGGSLTYKSLNPNESLNWRTKPEGDLGNHCIGTDAFAGTTDVLMVSPELIFTNQSFALMAEYNYIKLKNRDLGDFAFHGGYVALSYLLTGEHFNYSKQRGILTYIKPNEDFVRRCENGFFKTGLGAWQLCYRFSWIDYRQMPLVAAPEQSKVGICYDHTIGLNWQMTQTFRVVFDYVFSNNQYKYGELNKSGNVNVFTMSVQMYF